MKDTYNIIADIQALEKFVEWLPELQAHEIYYVGLYGRRKYAPDSGIRSDKCQLKSITTDKRRLIDKLRQMEVTYGAYLDRDTIIPNEALAVYITVNPRSQIEAARLMAAELAKMFGRPYNNYNVSKLALSCIHKAKSRSAYVDLDFDNMKFTDVKDEIMKHVNEEAITVLNTRGGFHLLINPTDVAKQFKNTWHKALTGFSGVDIVGDNMIPVMGCYQGGSHIPNIQRLINGVLCPL